MEDITIQGRGVPMLFQEAIRYHCTKFKADDVWFLEPTDLFEDRELRFGNCPKCNKKVIEFKERRKVDGKIFYSRITNNKMHNVIEREKMNLIYKTADLNCLPPLPYGWVFGINEETKDKKIKQYACDWNGNKKLL